ncbi:MAG: trimethylamine methyltransferase family protein [Gammaproteobacteria bacterium]|nr:trimethylamine methyltransferase family protein [Gammaproteobacteria bacterium]
MTEGAKVRSRRSRGERRNRGQAKYYPYIERSFSPLEVLSEEALATIEANADRLLDEVGIEFRDDPEAIQMWKDAGADIQGERVRFPKGMCRKIIQDSAPAQFTQYARNAERSVVIGGNNTVLVPAYGSPFIRNLDEGRRYANISDFQNFVKLAYMSPHIHHSGGTVCEPVDLPVNKRHLEMVYSHMRYSDKPYMGSVTAPVRAEDTVELSKILFGDDYIDPATGQEKTVVINLINANSPMVFDDTMLGAAKVYARNNQACVVSPFILAGAMSPVTVAGTCTQILAEAMAGMAFCQLVRKGAPVVFGTFAAAVSMQSGAPTFGGPEPSLVLYVCASLARRLGVPFRSGGGLNASKVADAQAGYEAANTLQTALLGGVNFMLHSAGWLEGGLVMSYEKFILDAEQCGVLGQMGRGVDMSENGQAMDAFQQVGPGEHFLGCAHTQANFESAFLINKTSDSNSFEQWESEGSLTAEQRANRIYKSMLESYEAPELDVAKDEALREYIEKRKASEPDANY